MIKLEKNITMRIQKIIDFLRNYNIWRRGTETEQPNPTELGVVIDYAILELEKRTKPYIVCAAIHYNDGLSYRCQPVNIITGYVVCGYRHDNVVYIHDQLSQGKTRRTDTMGFLTSDNRFVNREQASKIAFEAGQIDKPDDCLMSEEIFWL